MRLPKPTVALQETQTSPIPIRWLYMSIPWYGLYMYVEGIVIALQNCKTMLRDEFTTPLPNIPDADQGCVKAKHIKINHMATRQTRVKTKTNPHSNNTLYVVPECIVYFTKRALCNLEILMHCIASHNSHMVVHLKLRIPLRNVCYFKQQCSSWFISLQLPGRPSLIYMQSIAVQVNVTMGGSEATD